MILGTMPGEIYSGYEGASELIESDWLYWGDVYYLMDQANISVGFFIRFIVIFIKFKVGRKTGL